MWIIVQSESNLFTVGHYKPFGDAGALFIPFQDGNREECIKLCSLLNGGTGEIPLKGFYKGVPISET
jgi:hypothetical protein